MSNRKMVNYSGLDDTNQVGFKTASSTYVNETGRRQRELEEVATLINILSANYAGESDLLPPSTITRLHNIVDGMLEDLYPNSGPTEEQLSQYITLTTLGSGDIIEKEPTEEELDAASDSTERYYDYDSMYALIHATPGLKAARADWDNGLNEEYIVFVENAGMTKIYNSIKVEDFKYVKHKYKASDEDVAAQDWTLLNPELVGEV